MEMRIQLISASAGIPKTKLGIDLGSGVYFGFRHTPKSPTILYGLAEESSLGEKCRCFRIWLFENGLVFSIVR